ncbi:MAG: DUF2851 family protein [Sphingobacteriales bacterium]|nr:DUF2851 family protein [Sphingobacteriales bacterium]
MITEAFLQYIWRLRRFDTQNLLTTNTHETVEILQTGELNKQSGPDFFNARIRIGDTVWAGNVEVHIKTSDWLKHQHQHDKAYQNIILHVVSKGRCATIACRSLGFTCCGATKSHFACFVPQLSATTIHRSLGALRQTHQEY